MTDRSVLDGDAMFDALPHMVWISSPDGRETSMNARWYAYTGAEKGDPLFNFVHEDDRTGSADRWDRCVKAEESYVDRVRVRRQDGAQRWHDLRSEPLFDAAHHLMSWYGSVTDCHEHVMAQVACADREQQLQSILDSAGLGIWVAEHDGSLAEVGSMLASWTGMSRDALREGGLSHVIHPDDRPALEGEWADRITDGAKIEIEARLRQHDGRYVWVRVRGVRPTSSGEVSARWYGSIESIDAMKRLEDLGTSAHIADTERIELRTHQLEAALMELETYSYSVAHDLQAPLRAIISTSQMIKADYAEEMPVEAVHLLDRQISAGMRLAYLVRDLLVFARLGRSEIRRERVDIEEMVRSIVRDLFGNELSAVMTESPAEVSADPKLLRIALQNLIENGVKFSPPGSPVRVGTTPDGVLYVADHGVGFDMLEASRLFKPFQRLHSESEFQGSGIGLATVRRVAERHGGRVWVEARPGEGATFFLALGTP